MKCWITLRAEFYTTVGVVVRGGDCIKEECAWWDEVEGGRCAILSLVGSLDDIATKLMHIEQELTGLKEGR